VSSSAVSLMRRWSYEPRFLAESRCRVVDHGLCNYLRRIQKGLEMSTAEFTLREDELIRQLRLLDGKAVVANRHRDRQLIAWAEASGIAVNIMRGSKWGNPFRLRQDEPRDEVCDKFARLLQARPDLTADIPSLRGKLLVCCCHPLRCHGDELARLANG
jgi:hypothetical protein